MNVMDLREYRDDDGDLVSLQITRQPDKAAMSAALRIALGLPRADPVVSADSEAHVACVDCDCAPSEPLWPEADGGEG